MVQLIRRAAISPGLEFEHDECAITIPFTADPTEVTRSETCTERVVRHQREPNGAVRPTPLRLSTFSLPRPHLPFILLYESIHTTLVGLRALIAPQLGRLLLDAVGSRTTFWLSVGLAGTSAVLMAVLARTMRQRGIGRYGRLDLAEE